MEACPENHIRGGDHLFDVDPLLRLQHRCEPHLCRESGSCCAAHDAWINSEEHERLTRWFSRAAEFAPHLRECTGACRRLAPDLYVINKRPDGLCVFAFTAEGGRELCSLHAAAIEAGEEPESVKPRGCVLWPLCESGSELPVISVQPGAYDFPCNTPCAPAMKLRPGAAGLIHTACGPAVLRDLQEKLKARSRPRSLRCVADGFEPR